MDQEASAELGELAAAITQALDDAGLKGAEVARLFGVSKATLSRWQRGMNKPRGKELQRFFEVVDRALTPMTRRRLLEVAQAAAITLVSRRVPEWHDAGTRSEPTKPKSHEERAEELDERAEWARAREEWCWAADGAEKRGDWARWQRYSIAAAQMDLNLGEFKRGEQLFRHVLRLRRPEGTTQAAAEAYVRLGRLYYEQDRFAKAESMLEKGLELTRNRGATAVQEFRILDNGAAVACDGREAMVLLEHFALDFLGRTHIAKGAGKKTAALKGLLELDAACGYAESKGDDNGLGYRRLEKISGLILVGNDNDTEIDDLLRESSGLLRASPYGEGLVNLARAQWLMARGKPGGMSTLEAAHDGFTGRAFAPLGVANVNLEISGMYASNSREPSKALRYALAAVAFGPYRRALETLVEAVQEVFIAHDYDVVKFKRVWRALEEEVWDMRSAPFDDLDMLSERVGYATLRPRLTAALRLGRRIVERSVLEAPGALSG